MRAAGSSWRSWSASAAVLLSIAFWILAPIPASSEDSSTLPDPLWSALLQASSSLPQLIDDYSASWMQQIAELQASNGRLQTSNESLTLDVGSLRTSLEASRQELATSEAERSRLRSSLDDSTASITRAQAAADALARERDLWRIGAIAAGILAALAAGWALARPP
jgi:septal ring factor EnvC (AmiA/AmiB activator)